MKYISLDCETGGLTLDTSLLEVGFVIFDKYECQEYDFLVKPDDSIYNVTAQGLSVNKINLVEHDKVAIPYKDFKTQLYNILSEHKPLRVIGKNVMFDLQFVWKYLLKKETWESLVSYRVIELSSIIYYKQLLGEYPQDVSTSLFSIANQLEIPNDETHYHNGLYDAKLAMEIFKKLTNFKTVH